MAYVDKHVRKNKDIVNDKYLKDKFYADCGKTEFLTPVEIFNMWTRICEAVSGGLNEGSL